MGARPETLTGLSGLGDLILTCSSTQSRNFSLGIALGEGQTPAQASAAAGLAEGAFTAVALVELALEADVELVAAAGVDRDRAARVEGAPGRWGQGAGGFAWQYS